MILDWNKEYHRYYHYFVNIKGLYRSKRVVVYTGLTLTFVTISFFALIALRPTGITILSLIKEIDENKLIDQKLQKKISALTIAQSNLSQVSSSLSLIDDALPKDPALEEIIYQLESLISKQGLKIKSVGYDPVFLVGQDNKNKSKEEVRSVSFSISISGSFENLKNLLNELENLRRIIVIDTLTFNSGAVNEEKTISLMTTGRIFYFPDPTK